MVVDGRFGSCRLVCLSQSKPFSAGQQGTMPTEIDFSTLEFPKRIPEKLKAIRERLGLTPDEIAPKVGARTGAEILAYENDEDDLLGCGAMRDSQEFRLRICYTMIAICSLGIA